MAPTLQDRRRSPCCPRSDPPARLHHVSFCGLPDPGGFLPDEVICGRSTTAPNLVRQHGNLDRVRQP